MAKNSHMYDDTTTWSPFKGCNWDCLYCRPSFQQQAKRQKHLCLRCYTYTPHEHPERLGRIPSAKIVFVAGNGDICFADPGYTRRILDAIRAKNLTRPQTTYYLQSKQPGCFGQFLDELPPNIVLVTTLETNRDAGYDAVSKAPPPSERYRQFAALDYPRKVVTIEPVMDFDLGEFSQWMLDLRPQYIWLGFNSRPGQVALPEPDAAKFKSFWRALKAGGISVKPKDTHGLTI